MIPRNKQGVVWKECRICEVLCVAHVIIWCSINGCLLNGYLPLPRDQIGVVIVFKCSRQSSTFFQERCIEKISPFLLPTSNLSWYLGQLRGDRMRRAGSLSCSPAIVLGNEHLLCGPGIKWRATWDICLFPSFTCHGDLTGKTYRVRLFWAELRHQLHMMGMNSRYVRCK